MERCIQASIARILEDEYARQYTYRYIIKVLVLTNPVDTDTQ